MVIIRTDPHPTNWLFGVGVSLFCHVTEINSAWTLSSTLGVKIYKTQKVRGHGASPPLWLTTTPGQELESRQRWEWSSGVKQDLNWFSLCRIAGRPSGAAPCLTCAAAFQKKRRIKKAGQLQQMTYFTARKAFLACTQNKLVCEPFGWTPTRMCA